MQDEQLPKAVVVVLDAPDDVIRKQLLARGRVDDKPENIDRRIRNFATKPPYWQVGPARHVVRVNTRCKDPDVSKRIVAGLEEVWSKANDETVPARSR